MWLVCQRVVSPLWWDVSPVTRKGNRGGEAKRGFAVECCEGLKAARLSWCNSSVFSLESACSMAWVPLEGAARLHDLPRACKAVVKTVPQYCRGCSA